jgi:hypothetical protein
VKKHIYSTITYKNLDDLALRLESIQCMPDIESVDVVIEEKVETKNTVYSKVLILITKKEDDNCKITT